MHHSKCIYYCHSLNLLQNDELNFRLSCSWLKQTKQVSAYSWCINKPGWRAMQLLPSSLLLIEALVPLFFLPSAVQSRTPHKLKAPEYFPAWAPAPSSHPWHMCGLWAAWAHGHLSGLHGASPQLGRILAWGHLLPDNAGLDERFGWHYKCHLFYRKSFLCAINEVFPAHNYVFFSLYKASCSRDYERMLLENE